MARLPPTLRALLLVPLLAVAVDQARATFACGPRAASCLEAAGQGWLGSAATVLLVLYAAGLALFVGRLARGVTVTAARSPGFLALWGLGTAGIAAVCGGQALLAGALGDGAALGGGWPELLAFCAVAGVALALALRAAPAAAALVRSLRPLAPRPLAPGTVALRLPAAPARRPQRLLLVAAPGRGPPAPLD